MLMGQGREAVHLIYNISDLSQKRILDIGFGTGEILKKFSNAFGIDIKYNLVSRAKKYQPQNEFAVGEAGSLPFMKNIFDIVIATEVLEHVDDEAKMISEIIRVLSKDGYLVLTVPSNKILFKILDYQLWMEKLGKGHHRHYSISDIEKKIKNFKMIKCYEKGFLITPIFTLFALPFNLIDKYVLNSTSIGSLLRKLWAPLINFEYKFDRKRGDTIFILARMK